MGDERCNFRITISRMPCTRLGPCHKIAWKTPNAFTNATDYISIKMRYSTMRSLLIAPDVFLASGGSDSAHHFLSCILGHVKRCLGCLTESIDVRTSAQQSLHRRH